MLSLCHPKDLLSVSESGIPILFQLPSVIGILVIIISHAFYPLTGRLSFTNQLEDYPNVNIQQNSAMNIEMTT